MLSSRGLNTSWRGLCSCGWLLLRLWRRGGLSATGALAMEPIAPHLAEEIWSILGGEGLVVKAPWPQLRPDPVALLAKRYVDMVIDDVKRIPAFGEGVKRVVIYVNPNYAWVKAALSGDVKAVINAGAPPQAAKRVVDIVKTLGDELRGLISAVGKFDEAEALASYKNYMEKALGAPMEIYNADDPSAPDLGGKKKVALPLRPGIYIEK